MKNEIVKTTIIHSSGKVSVYSLLETEVLGLENAFINAKKRSIKDTSPELFIFASIFTPRSTGRKITHNEKTLVDLTRVDSISFNRDTTE